MKIMILGAAGQIGKLVTADLLEQTDFDIVLYGRNVSKRLSYETNPRVTLVDGTFEELEKIREHVQAVDVVYLSYVAGEELVVPLVELLEEAQVPRFIAASIPDIYQEMTGSFQKWYRENTGIMWNSTYWKAADAIENSSLDYVILRITWLYNEAGNTRVHLTRKGEPFTEAQVTREAVAQVVTDLVTGKLAYHRESLGLGEPGTAFEKPSFY